MEQRYKDLCAKQGFRDHYKTVEERDKVYAYEVTWCRQFFICSGSQFLSLQALTKEIRFYDRQLNDTKAQIESIENSLQEEEQEEQELNTKIRVI